ncbi:MAG: hypothetical protein HRU15_02040, partial [Planctomycetes bacterium]|nr:hypothetical protein [Planctomycetota bacterium]
MSKKSAIHLCGPVTLEAAAPNMDEQPDSKKLRNFSMVAYTGAAMQVFGWDAPVVVDLEGLQVTAKARPILKDHNPSVVIGHTSSVRASNGQLLVDGIISGAGRSAKELVATADNGFPWQASIGASISAAVYVPTSKTAFVNGQEFTGPLYIARQSQLGEVSFVALGADDNTETHIAASNSQNQSTNTQLKPVEILSMEFEQWLQANKKTITNLSADEVMVLRATYNAEVQATAEKQRVEKEKAVTLNT